jgi:hypothetical protein
MSIKQYLCFGTFLLVCGCTNPFSTRSVETPDNTQESDIFDVPTSFEKVFSNLKFALEQKNVVNYMNCLVDTALSAAPPYRFIPDPTIQWNELTNWQLEDERNYVNKLFKDAVKISFEYLTDPDPQLISNSIDIAETRFFLYQFKITLDTEIVFTGKARMRLVKNELSLWSVYLWEDFRDESDNPDTWSELKARYRN